MALRDSTYLLFPYTTDSPFTRPLSGGSIRLTVKSGSTPAEPPTVNYPPSPSIVTYSMLSYVCCQ